MSNYSTYKGINTVTLDVTERDGTGSMFAPAGTTAERPASTAEGQLRYNTTTGLYEQYTATGWQAIDAPPTVSSISGTINENTNSTITITGTGFKTGSVVSIEGAGVSGTPRALTTTFVSSTELTAATAAASVNYVAGESFDVKVTNTSGLTGSLSPAGDVDSDPIWSTSAGTIATINDAYGSYSPIATLSASDPEGTSITYAVASGSLPTNVSLNSSTGAISGDPANETSASTTYSFTASATSNTQVATRSFNIIVNRTGDGTSSTRYATSAATIKSLTGTTTDGFYWIQTTGMASPVQIWCDMNTGGGGWMRFWWYGKYEITGSDPSTGDWTVDRDLFSGTLESTFAYDSVRGFNHIPTGYSIGGLMIKGNSPVQTKNGSALRYAIYNTTLTGNTTRNAVLDAMQNQTGYSPADRNVWAPTADGSTGGSASGYNNLLSGNYYNNGGPDFFAYSTVGSGVGSASTSPYKSFQLDDDGGYGNQSWGAGNDSGGAPGVDFFSNDDQNSRTQNLVMYFK